MYTCRVPGLQTIFLNTLNFHSSEKNFTLKAFQVVSPSNIFSEVKDKKEEQLITFVYTKGPHSLIFSPRDWPEADTY